MTQSLLVYDGSNELFQAAANRISRHLDGVKPVPWQSEAIQQFLDAQFDDRLFAFILIEEDTVHVGAETVKQVLTDQGVSPGIIDVITRTYPSAAGPFGRLVHGEEPADIHDSFPLTPEARTHIAPLRESHVIPVDSEY